MSTTDKEKEYQNSYYLNVTKPKRQALAQQKQQEIIEQYAGEIEIERVCPICNTHWTEKVVWNAKRKPSVKKRCPECIKKQQQEYCKNPENRERINANARKNYASNEGVRKRRKQATYNWRSKILSNPETAQQFQARVLKNTQNYQLIHQEEINANNRKRYAEDEEYRQSKLTATKKWRENQQSK